jgi:hypothetical protein
MSAVKLFTDSYHLARRQGLKIRQSKVTNLAHHLPRHLPGPSRFQMTVNENTYSLKANYEYCQLAA